MAPADPIMPRGHRLFDGARAQVKRTHFLRADENTQPEEKRDGYQIDDGAGNNSHGQTGVAAGTFAGNSLFVGNSDPNLVVA